MLKIVINGRYYLENKRFSSFNARQKKDMVYFYDYDGYIEFIINSLSYSDLQKLRINIYNAYQKLIKFTKCKEFDVNNEVFEYYKVESDIISIDNTDFASLLPNIKIRKNFFDYDDIREKYFLKSDFINFVNFHVL